MKPIRVCQSCGLPMSGENMFGTHGDGHPCSEYCRNCFQKGFFTAASLDEQQKAIAASGRKGHADLSNLKRWMPAVQQAAWILDRCGYVTLSTIDENGFPRPPKAGICYVHEADSVTLTGTAEIIDDMETRHAFWKDFMKHYFPEGPDDPDYCILCFHAEEATFWIDRKFKHIVL